MRHVAVMTTTGMIGLTFMFLIDAITLFWVSRLENESFMAAMGFAWTVQFFTISVGIAFMIATTALVSRSLGAENWEDARKQTTVFALLIHLLLLLIEQNLQGILEFLLSRLLQYRIHLLAHLMLNLQNLLK